MPHDKNGQLLKVGDKVTVAWTITAIASNDDSCNLTLESVEKMPFGGHTSSMTLNTKQVELLAPAEKEP